MDTCIIFGGAGYIGTHLAQFLLATKRFSHIHIADIKPSPLQHLSQISYTLTDVRKPIPVDLTDNRPSWIFNLAAIHREPGHEPQEYFETNILGAKNISAYATSINCNHLFFTSSIAVYGPTSSPTNEDKLPMPTTPYGSSKLPAELIHQIWLAEKAERRLIITRPGVVYGPGDPGNIMRMIKAIRKGYFVFPGSKSIYKSYAYIYGFLESIEFMMEREEPLLIYNYVETPTETIGDIALALKNLFQVNSPIISLPSSLLVPVSVVLQNILPKLDALHPVRVKKAGTQTHIIPQKLISLGFPFKYDFKKSIQHWRTVSPEDFE